MTVGGFVCRVEVLAIFGGPHVVGPRARVAMAGEHLRLTGVLDVPDADPGRPDRVIGDLIENDHVMGRADRNGSDDAGCALVGDIYDVTAVRVEGVVLAIDPHVVDRTDARQGRQIPRVHRNLGVIDVDATTVFVGGVDVATVRLDVADPVVSPRCGVSWREDVLGDGIPRVRGIDDCKALTTSRDQHVVVVECPDIPRRAG